LTALTEGLLAQPTRSGSSTACGAVACGSLRVKEAKMLRPGRGYAGGARL